MTEPKCEIYHVDDSLDWLNAREDESVDLVYVDPPFNTGRNRSDFDDSWPTLLDYVNWIAPYVKQSHRILKPTGNMIVHLDYRAVHWVKVGMDEVFGVENFRNEIIWCYKSGGASKRWLARKHDNLLWYSKTDDYTYNLKREPYAHDYGDRPGFHPEGRVMNDWWEISILSTNSKQRTGYDTEKPPELARRVIQLFSNGGDTVLDFFAGSGVAGRVAVNEGRNAILVDKNLRAIGISRDRFKGGSPSQVG